MTDAPVISPTLNVPQATFLALKTQFNALVTGFGGGKTWVGCSGLAKHFYEWPKVNSGYFAPTYRDIKDTFFPTVEEAWHGWGLRCVIRLGDKEVDAYRGRQYRGTVLCRSMDDPSGIVGFKIGHALVDEIDVLSKDKATLAWRKILARLRVSKQGLRNGADVTTTPEGFKFVYETFKKGPQHSEEAKRLYGLVQASTYDNAANLPPGYIPQLLASYPPQLIDAYLNGQFVNLTTGTVYSAFDRTLNNSSEVMQPGEVLYIGMDFNVGKMAAIVHVKREGLPIAVDEIVNGYDTPDMVAQIKARYCGDDKHQIRVYPDSSGDSRKTVNASKTDLQLLRDAGFIVCAPASNPPVKDRVNSMNAMFCNAEGERRYKVNVDKCPTYTECLEQQPWAENGEPDKKTGHDHAVDAGGYFIHKEYPVLRRSTFIGFPG